jgi:hypothetical protein
MDGVAEVGRLVLFLDLYYLCSNSLSIDRSSCVPHVRLLSRGAPAVSHDLIGATLRKWQPRHPPSTLSLLPFHLLCSTTLICHGSHQAPAKLEREKKIRAVLSEYCTHLPHLACSPTAGFGSSLTKRIENERDGSLIDEFQTQLRGLPLQPSSTLTARQDELDRLGTELWNLSTRLRRDDSAPSGRSKDEVAHKKRLLCLLRVFSFLVLDSAAAQAKGRPRKSCIRLMKVALKAARVCIDGNELSNSTKVLERAAEYQDILSGERDGATEDEGEAADRLRLDYFAVRMLLVSCDADIGMASMTDRYLLGMASRPNGHG